MIDMVMFGGRIAVSDPQALDHHGVAFSLQQSCCIATLLLP